MWRSADKAQIAAEALRLTADDMLALGVIDDIVKEPLGGAHRNINAALDTLSASISAQLTSLNDKSGESLIADRADKYIKIGDLSLSSA